MVTKKLNYSIIFDVCILTNGGIVMSVICTEAYFNSSDSVHKIRTLIWKEEELTPIGVVQIAHGMAEHIGRYSDFASFLASNGFVVCGNDHLGHGKSVNDSSEYGFFAEKDGHIRLVDDMHILTKIMKKKYPEGVHNSFRQRIKRRDLLRNRRNTRRSRNSAARCRYALRKIQPPYQNRKNGRAF